MSSSLTSITTTSGVMIPLRTDINTTIDLSTFTSATDWLREITKVSHHVMAIFNNDRVVQAAHLLTSCITTSERLLSTATEQEKQELLQHIDVMKNGEQFMYVRDVETELQALRISCREEKEDGVEWTKLDEHAGITTWYRKDSSYATHSFKVSGEVSAPLFNLIAIVYEIDLFAHWLPAIHSSTKLCHIDGSRFRMLAQMMIDVPWPVTNREVLFYGYGDVLDREVAIYFRSIHPHESFTTTEKQVHTSTSETSPPPTSSPPSSSEPISRPVELPSCPPKHVRCEVRQGGFIIHPIDVNRSKVTVLFNIDPKLSLIPYWFLNMISSKFCYVLIELMRKHAPKLGPEFDSRIATNRRVYGEIERRLAEVEPKKEDGKKKETSKKENHTLKQEKSISKSKQLQAQQHDTSKQAHATPDDNDEEEYDIVYHDASSPSQCTASS